MNAAHRTRAKGNKAEDEAEQFFAHGLPASIDDPANDPPLLLHGIDFNFGITYAKRSKLFRLWLDRYPSVTLPNAAWLLAGRDPLDPQGTEPEAAPPDLQRLYRSILIRLECEVASGVLKPVGKTVHGFDRHFVLLKVANVAIQIGLAESTAEHLVLVSNSAIEPPDIPWQSRNRAQRMVVHRELIDMIRLKAPAEVHSLAPTSNKQGGRVLEDPLNLLLPLQAMAYDHAFKELFKSKYGGLPRDPISKSMLRQDRSDLNVGLPPGRPKGEPNRKR